MHGNLIENEFPVAWKNATCGGPFWPWEREGGDGGGRGERRCPRWAHGAGESGAEDEESSGTEARGGPPGPELEAGAPRFAQKNYNFQKYFFRCNKTRK
jgi:hypothetical protein